MFELNNIHITIECQTPNQALANHKHHNACEDKTKLRLKRRNIESILDLVSICDLGVWTFFHVRVGTRNGERRKVTIMLGQL